MRIAVWGALAFACLAFWLLWLAATPGVVFAQRPATAISGESSRLIAVTATVGDNRQQLTVIDPELRVVSVYHIELSTGKITLQSVRNIHWDLQMLEYNGTNPLPQEIRSQMHQK